MALVVRIAGWVLIGLLVIAVTLILDFACSSSVKDIGGDTIEPRPAVPAVSLASGHRTFVALGDSYSSGEGVRPYLPGSGDRKDGGDRCHRSTNAYSEQIKFAPPVRIRFRACSGARLNDMYETQRTPAGEASLGPQLREGVLGPEVGLVTVTIGGNDLGFTRVLKFCMSHPRVLKFIPGPWGNCLKETFDDSFDDGKKSGLSLSEWTEKKLGQLRPRLRAFFETLRRGAPNARILVLGYPNIFWTQFGGGMGEFDKDCILDTPFLSTSEVNGILDIEYRFNDTLARLAHTTGIEYVPTATTFLGHEACGRLTPRWVDYIIFRGGEAGRFDPGSMHPNRNGHYIIARLISCYLSIRANVSWTEEQLADCARWGKIPSA